MGKIIAVVSGKGGTGKTSFAANTGIALADMGYRTLCMDCDVMLRNLDLALGLSDQAMMDFSDVVDGRCTLSDAVVTHSQYPKLQLLASPTSSMASGISRSKFQKMIQEIRESYDYCLIDSSAGLGLGFQMATAFADSAIVVTTTDISALRDAQRTVIELNRFPAGKLHLVVCRVQRKLLKDMHTTIDDAIDTAGLPLLGVVPEDIDVFFALNRGIPLREYNYYAARAYENIAKRITGLHVPLMNI
ncbi:MAG: septum site-determining protein MinD [Clostridiales bacterium]|nr:septum site-determining protein MinD [Candidatus Cacconaster stercorequi]